MNRADDRCAGTARDGGPCTFTRAGHADSKPHAFVDAFDEVAQLKGELAEAKRLLETAPVGGFAEASLEWRRRKDAFLAAPPTALNENAGGEGLGCDNCDVESPAASSCRYRNERAQAAGWLVEDDLVLCPRCKPAESTPVLCEQHGREDCPRPDHAAPLDDIRERLDEALENIERMKERYSEQSRELAAMEQERNDWRQQRVDVGLRYDLFKINHKGKGCGRREGDAALEAKGEASWCYSVDCRHYGQRHATAHEPRDVEPKGAKP